MACSRVQGEGARRDPLPGDQQRDPGESVPVLLLQAALPKHVSFQMLGNTAMQDKTGLASYEDNIPFTVINQWYILKR